MVDADTIVFENWCASCLYRQRGRISNEVRQLQQLDRQIMKRSRADVQRAMNVGRLREPDFAKFPLRFCRWSRGILKAQVGVAQRDDYIVVAVDMPQSRFAGRHSNIPDPQDGDELRR